MLGCYSQLCFTFPAATILQPLPTCIINIYWRRDSKGLKKKELWKPESLICVDFCQIRRGQQEEFACIVFWTIRKSLI